MRGKRLHRRGHARRHGKGRIGVAAGPALAVLVLFLALGRAGDGTLAADSAWALVSRDALLVIDVRTDREWRSTGLPEMAIGISLAGERAAFFVDAVLEAVDGDLSHPLATICASGVRSARAADILRRHGFVEVYDVSEGMMGNGLRPGWIERGLPLRAMDGGSGS